MFVFFGREWGGCKEIVYPRYFSTGVFFSFLSECVFFFYIVEKKKESPGGG